MYYMGELHIFSSSAVGLEHFNIEEGGKVVLPPSVLAELSDYSSESPMLFRLSHPVTEVLTHCGVIEFSAEEGSVVAPSWVLEQIGVVPGETVFVESVFLPVGSYARFKPQSVSFLDITNQKAVLENKLRHFSCLTCGDLIPLHYNQKEYLLRVVSTQPGDAICIVNCDLEVEFEEPVGYIPPEKNNSTQQNAACGENLPSSLESMSFTGTGYRLDGKAVKNEQFNGNSSQPRGIPDYDWKLGTLIFNRDFKKPSVNKNESGTNFSPFSGSGRSLK